MDRNSRPEVLKSERRRRRVAEVRAHIRQGLAAQILLRKQSKTSQAVESKASFPRSLTLLPRIRKTF